MVNYGADKKIRLLQEKSNICVVVVLVQLKHKETQRDKFKHKKD